MSDIRMVSGKWVEGLFSRSLGTAISGTLSEQLKAAGLHLDRPLASSYPRTSFVQWLQLAAADLYPGVEAEAALERLGGRVVEELQSSGGLRGPVLTMAKLMGPRRTLRQLVDFVQGQSSLKIDVDEKSKYEVHLTLNESDLAPFVAGSLMRILQAIGAKQPAVATRVLGGDASQLALTWS